MMSLIIIIALGVVLGLFIFKKPMAAMVIVIMVLLLALIVVELNSPTQSTAQHTAQPKVIYK
jgi:hypothetical protein